MSGMDPPAGKTRLGEYLAAGKDVNAKYCRVRMRAAHFALPTVSNQPSRYDERGVAAPIEGE